MKFSKITIGIGISVGIIFGMATPALPRHWSQHSGQCYLPRVWLPWR